MEVSGVWTALLWLNIVFVSTSNTPLNVSRIVRNTYLKGFSLKPIKNFGTFQETAEYKAHLPRLVASLGGVGTLAMINYDKPANQVIKEVGDAVIPMVQFALSLFPAGGPLLGGIVAGVWGLLSPLFGGPPEKSPIERMIDEVKHEIKRVKEQLKELGKKIPEHMENVTSARLSQIINKGVHSEIQRNEYICSKYAVTSARFGEDIRNQRSLNESLRFEMIALMNDCDNFLKDTAGLFVYDEFADTLWVPAVVATMMRLTFLADALNYGIHLKIDDEMVTKWWTELKLDLKQILKFFITAIRKRMQSLKDVKTYNDKELTSIECDVCRLQAQLLYFDRDYYVYGAPKFFRIHDNNAELKVSDFILSDNVPRVIQIYYNGKGKEESYNSMSILNCINSLSEINEIGNKSLSFRVLYVANKSYQIRVLYFMKKKLYMPNKTQTLELENVQRDLIVTEERDNSVRIVIERAHKKRKSKNKRFRLEAGYLSLFCYNGDPILYSMLGRNLYKKSFCISNQLAYDGIYTIENAFGFIVSPDETNLEGKITIVTDEWYYTLIMGVELIVLPL